MLRRVLASSDWIDVDDWECNQETSFSALTMVRSLSAYIRLSIPSLKFKMVYLCGADLMAKWEKMITYFIVFYICNVVLVGTDIVYRLDGILAWLLLLGQVIPKNWKRKSLRRAKFHLTSISSRVIPKISAPLWFGRRWLLERIFLRWRILQSVSTCAKHQRQSYTCSLDCQMHSRNNMGYFVAIICKYICNFRIFLAGILFVLLFLLPPVTLVNMLTHTRRCPDPQF